MQRVLSSHVKSISATSVFFLTVVMAGASGLGAVPFFFVGALSKEYAALASAIACGVMLAASFDLLHEGQPYGAGLVIFGLILGETLFCTATAMLHMFVSALSKTYAALASTIACGVMLAASVDLLHEGQPYGA